jgi:predicted permease
LLDALKNPLLLAVFLSIVLLITDTKLPYVVLKTVDLLAGGATPIILISLGIFLARELPKVKYRNIIGLVGLKLFAMPTIFLLYFFLAGETEVLAISVLEAGMPMAITPFILAELYPMEREIIAIGIVLSCIFSVFTLPLLMVLVGVV